MDNLKIDGAAEKWRSYLRTTVPFRTYGIKSAPPSNFTEPNRERVEMEVIFTRVLPLLALSCERPRPGDYKTMES